MITWVTIKNWWFEHMEVKFHSTKLLTLFYQDMVKWSEDFALIAILEKELKRREKT